MNFSKLHLLLPGNRMGRIRAGAGRKIDVACKPDPAQNLIMPLFRWLDKVAWSKTQDAGLWDGYPQGTGSG